MKEFVYLSSMFTNYGKYENDIERTVNTGNQVIGALHTDINNRKVSKKAYGLV